MSDELSRIEVTLMIEDAVDRARRDLSLEQVRETENLIKAAIQSERERIYREFTYTLRCHSGGMEYETRETLEYLAGRIKSGD